MRQSPLTRPNQRRAVAARFAIAIGSVVALSGCTSTIAGSPAATGGTGAVGGSQSGTGVGQGGSGATQGGSTGARGGTGGSGGSGGSADTAGTSSTTGGTGAIADPGDPNAAGPMPLAHLTSREYLNTVSDLVGDKSLGSSDVPSENSGTTFDFFPFKVPGTVGSVEAELLQSAAEQVAKNVAAHVSSISPCTPKTAADESSCAQQFIGSFGAKAYRRPLDSGETSRLTALYQTARTTLNLDFNGALTLLVEAILQSPGFYYHWEKDPASKLSVDANGVAALDPSMLANRLSYFLWGSMPDQPLFDAAQNGGLTTDADIDAQARRMLKDPKARGTIVDFVDDWLDLDLVVVRPKDATFYPAWNGTLQQAMVTESEKFATGIVIDGSGKFDDLLTSNATWVNQPLASLYGLNVTGMTFQSATLDATQRGGLLTRAAFLANTGDSDESAPPRRGKVVLTRLLCDEMPPPPNSVPTLPAVQKGVSMRMRMEEHDKSSCARGCHSILDGLGFAFEHYDGIGTFRTTDQGVAVDSTSSYDFEGIGTQSFADAIELSRVIAGLEDARRCFSTQWLRYAFRRTETDADTASLNSAYAAFTASGDDTRELIVALAKSRTFRYRTPAEGEVLQ